ncbi:DNA replication protein psf2 [Rhizina undulata]
MSTQLPGTGPLTPAEVAFLCESENITIIPRQRLEGLDFISGYIPSFQPPQRVSIPLWLALLLKKQKRCNILAPGWLTSANIERILKIETESPGQFCEDLPYRWLETAEILLDAAADDIEGDEGDLRVLLRELREVRQSKAREGLGQLEGTYLQMNSLGLMEITEIRGFAKGVVDTLRKIGSSREDGRRNREEEEEGRGEMAVEEEGDEF